MDLEPLKAKNTLTLHEAALLLAGDATAVRDAEQQLAHAIDRGELPASILRWATEQWAGDQLQGNIDRMRTVVNRADLEAWLANLGRSLPLGPG